MNFNILDVFNKNFISTITYKMWLYYYNLFITALNTGSLTIEEIIELGNSLLNADIVTETNLEIINYSINLEELSAKLSMLLPKTRIR